MKFYEITGYPNYLITKCGKVYNRESENYLQGSVNPDGYVNFRLTNQEGTKTFGLHRLLGIVFIKTDLPIDECVINHINGIKDDNRLENLEWVTYQENAEHAGATGLTTKCIPIEVLDISTGEVQEFPSIVKCARAFGYTKDALIYRVKTHGQRLFPEGKQYRSKASGMEWAVFTDTVKEMAKFGLAKTVYLKNLLDGSVETIADLKTLAGRFDVSQSTITSWLQKNQPVLPGFFLIKTDELVPWREVEDIYLELEKTTAKRCVVVWNETQCFLYPSGVDCAIASNIKPTALSYRLKSNQLFNGFRYSYYSDFIQIRLGHAKLESLDVVFIN